MATSRYCDVFGYINSSITHPGIHFFRLPGNSENVLLGTVYGDLTFPPGFKFGIASASYQVEGAWNVSDKTENIWDRFSHTHSEKISDGSNGDVACDSYNLWRRDIEMIEELGAHFYRFSISWSRLLPSGFPNKISEDGKKYYSNLIDGLLEKGIEPIVTIFHWDLPQSLQDLGGWVNPLISEWFADYARVVYSLYADRVKTWITLNEPLAFCDSTYNNGEIAPGILDADVGTNLCCKNVLIAHAKAWRIYDEEFRAKYKGEVSLSNHAFWYEGVTPEDESLAELARQNAVGRYAHAVFTKKGGWPPSIDEIMKENAKKKGYNGTSNWPSFTDEEIEFVKGTFDFFGLNSYTSRQVRAARPGEVLRSWPFGDAPDLNLKLEHHPDWPQTTSSWNFVNPKGIHDVLLWIKKQYGDVKILITENGYPNHGGLDDQDRVKFFRDYLQQVLLAIKKGVNVTGFTAWTLMDNFEWMDGYVSKFGLYEVDFNSPQRTRTPKASAKEYARIIRTRSLDVYKKTDL